MKVEDLISRLSKIPGDTELVIKNDYGYYSPYRCGSLPVLNLAAEDCVTTLNDVKFAIEMPGIQIEE